MDSYNDTEAERAISFQPGQLAVEKLVDAGREVLTRFPYKPGACALMTAMWAAFIRDNTEYPIHAVAGVLIIDNQLVFGNNYTTKEIKSAFSGINFDWDGHCWIVFGDLIGDISLFRTAYSDKSPFVLKKKILSEFGEGRGLLLCPSENLVKTGICYDPKYVLTDNEITGLFKGAITMIENPAIT